MEKCERCVSFEANSTFFPVRNLSFDLSSPRLTKLKNYKHQNKCFGEILLWQATINLSSSKSYTILRKIGSFSKDLPKQRRFLSRLGSDDERWEIGRHVDRNRSKRKRTPTERYRLAIARATNLVSRHSVHREIRVLRRIGLNPCINRYQPSSVAIATDDPL